MNIEERFAADIAAQTKKRTLVDKIPTVTPIVPQTILSHLKKLSELEIAPRDQLYPATKLTAIGSGIEPIASTTTTTPTINTKTATTAPAAVRTSWKRKLIGGIVALGVGALATISAVNKDKPTTPVITPVETPITAPEATVPTPVTTVQPAVTKLPLVRKVKVQVKNDKGELEWQDRFIVIYQYTLLPDVPKGSAAAPLEPTKPDETTAPKPVDPVVVAPTTPNTTKINGLVPDPAPGTILYGIKGLGSIFDQAAFEQFAKERGYVPIVITQWDLKAAINDIVARQKDFKTPYAVYGFSYGAKVAISLVQTIDKLIANNKPAMQPVAVFTIGASTVVSLKNAFGSIPTEHYFHENTKHDVDGIYIKAPHTGKGNIQQVVADKFKKEE